MQPTPVPFIVESIRRVPPELVQIADAVKKGAAPQHATVRSLLEWFSAHRRGSYVVQRIRDSLSSLGLRTVPDFDAVWIDADIIFEPIPTARNTETVAGPAENGAGVDGAGGTIESAHAILVGGTVQDPTYRIGKLEAANKKVVAVTPNETINEAITIMLINGFSQVPVMQSDRDVKGVISWESIGARLALGRRCTEVRECMSPAQVIGAEKSLFAAIDIIAQCQYVLVQAADRTISGIVTASDLSLQFQQLSEPFLLLGEIEQHIRRLICGKFTADELKGVRDPNDSGREIESVADLAMGEYIRLLEDPTYWERLGLPIDRAAFIEHLQTVRRIRNDIMHFDPDPLGRDDLASLRQFAVFMRSLRELGVVQ